MQKELKHKNLNDMTENLYNRLIINDLNFVLNKWNTNKLVAWPFLFAVAFFEIIFKQLRGASLAKR